MAKKGWSGSPKHTGMQSAGPVAGSKRSMVQGPGTGKSGAKVRPNNEATRPTPGGAPAKGMKVYRAGDPA